MKVEIALAAFKTTNETAGLFVLAVSLLPQVSGATFSSCSNRFSSCLFRTVAQASSAVATQFRLSNCGLPGSRARSIVAHRLSCSAVCDLLDWGSNPLFPVLQEDSLPLSHQGGPQSYLFI